MVRFVAYAINRRGATSDAALALPIDTFNTDFIVLDYSTRSGLSTRSNFLVYAAFDMTTVTITPTSSLQGSRPADVPFDITLNQGDGFLAVADTLAALSGSTVVADKPIGMANGHGCADVPETARACDHLYEIAQPVQTWGTEIGVVGLPLRTGGTIYRVVAAKDTTEVTLNGTGTIVATDGSGNTAAVLVAIGENGGGGGGGGGKGGKKGRGHGDDDDDNDSGKKGGKKGGDDDDDGKGGKGKGGKKGSNSDSSDSESSKHHKNEGGKRIGGTSNAHGAGRTGT
ncbi:MAG: hypothetical protein SGILL_004306, partial [Bacillariaceae sp.]